MMASEIQQFLDVKPAGIRLQEGEDFLSNIMGSSGGTGDGAGGGDSGGGIRIDDANFNFRTDILLNDLIHTLSGFRYDPNAVTDLKRSSSIDEEVAVLDEFSELILKGSWPEKMSLYLRDRPHCWNIHRDWEQI